MNLHQLTQRCCGGYLADQVKAELGKKDAIHWLAMIYRDVIEDPGGDQLQLLLYTLTVLCDGNRACPAIVCGWHSHLLVPRGGYSCTQR